MSYRLSRKKIRAAKVVFYDTETNLKIVNRGSQHIRPKKKNFRQSVRRYFLVDCDTFKLTKSLSIKLSH